MALQRLLRSQQASPAGQNLPAADSDGDADGSTTSTAAPAAGGAPGFAGNTLASLLGVQTDDRATRIASTVMNAFDADKSGSLSLDEVTQAIDKAMGSNAPDASTLKAAFDKLDANGDGQISTSELVAAARQQQQAQGAGHAHHGHHAHGAPPSSDQLAQDILSEVGGQGATSVSVSDLTQALDPTAASDSSSSSTSADPLAAAVAKMDTNSDGQISADELKTALDAFRQAQDAAWQQEAQSAGAVAASTTTA